MTIDEINKASTELKASINIAIILFRQKTGQWPSIEILHTTTETMCGALINEEPLVKVSISV